MKIGIVTESEKGMEGIVNHHGSWSSSISTGEGETLAEFNSARNNNNALPTVVLDPRFYLTQGVFNPIFMDHTHPHCEPHHTYHESHSLQSARHSFNSVETTSRSLPIAIDLTGPSPVVGVFTEDGFRQHQKYYHSSQPPQSFNLNGSSKGNAVNSHHRTTTVLFERLIKEAPLLPCIPPPSSSEIEEKQDVSIDAKLVEEGRTFIRRNFFAIMFAHCVGVAFLLAVKPIQAFLLRTGSIHEKSNTFKRYFSLIISVKRLYECDILNVDKNETVKNHDEESYDSRKGYRINSRSKTIAEIENLKKLMLKKSKQFRLFVPPPAHLLQLTEEEQSLLKAFQSDVKFLNAVPTGVHSEGEFKNLDKIFTTVNPTVPLSQYDMSIVTFAFFGFISLFPQTFGIHSSKGLKGFVYLWSLFATKLGVLDQFNLASSTNFDQLTNMEVFSQIYLFSLKLADENLLRLWRTMMSGSSRYFFFFRTKSLLYFMLRNVSSLPSSPDIYQTMSLAEKFCYNLYLFFTWLLQISIVRMFLNLCARLVFTLGEKLFLKKSTWKYTSCITTDNE